MRSTNRKRRELFKLGFNRQKKLKKCKIINNGKTEEVSFLFIYYFKSFGTRKLVSQILWIRILICVSIFCHILHKEYWQTTLNGYIVAVGDYIKQSCNCYCKKNWRILGLDLELHKLKTLSLEKTFKIFFKNNSWSLPSIWSIEEILKV